MGEIGQGQGEGDAIPQSLSKTKEEGRIIASSSSNHLFSGKRNFYEFVHVQWNVPALVTSI